MACRHCPLRGTCSERLFFNAAMARIRKCHRQACGYADRFQPLPKQPQDRPYTTGDDAEPSCEVWKAENQPPALSPVHEWFELLPGSDRSLMTHLVLEGETERDVAAQLGLTQQAVNKRRRAILESGRKFFKKKFDTPVVKRGGSLTYT
jgi:hypothetical protein